MNMTRPRLNLVLLLIAVLLGLLVWRAQAPQTVALTAIDPAGVSRIEISDLKGRHILLQKVDGAWQTQGGPARQERVEQLLGICGTPSLERFDASGDLRPYGLDPAPILLRLDDETLDFGATDPLHGWRYVRYRERIHLIADGFYHHLSAMPEAWREIP